MNYVILVLVLVGIFMAWQSNRKHKALNERISQLNGRIHQTRREMTEAQEKTRYELTQLKFDLLKAQGTLKVTAAMTIDEIIAAYPYVEPEDVRQALQYAAWLAEETVHPLDPVHP